MSKTEEELKEMHQVDMAQCIAIDGHKKQIRRGGNMVIKYNKCENCGYCFWDDQPTKYTEENIPLCPCCNCSLVDGGELL
jgi:predicted Zn-ribbon and HTH transcriptional regulator